MSTGAQSEPATTGTLGVLWQDARALAACSGELDGHGVLFLDGRGRSTPLWLALQPPAACLGWVQRKRQPLRREAITRPSDLLAPGVSSEALATLALLRALAEAFPLELALLALQRGTSGAVGESWPQALPPPTVPAALQALWQQAQELGLEATGWRQLLRQLGGLSEPRCERALLVLQPQTVTLLNVGLATIQETSWYASRAGAMGPAGPIPPPPPAPQYARRKTEICP